ncbi:MAG: autotransporter outer membrane beta-barrel domain-containing protein, partial [Cyanobacteria bacterium J06607_10]
SGGAVDLRADGSANPSGVPGNQITFAAGSTANVQAQNVTGAQPLQTFINTTFSPGTIVGTGSGFIRGVTSNDTATGTGQIQLSSDFTNSARTANGRNIGRVLNDLAASPTLSAAQQTALNSLIANATDTREGEAILSNVAGEVQVHAAASGLNAALGFNEAILPAGNRTSSRNAVLINGPKQNDNESNFYEPTISNGVWVSGLGSALNVSSNDNSTAFNANGYGIAVGYDRVASEGPSHAAVFGIGAGYSTTNVSSIRDSATVNAFSVGTYFDGSAGALSGNIAASYSSQNVSSSASNGGSGSIFALSSEAFYNVRPNAKLAIGPIGQLGAAFGSYSGFSTNNNAFTVAYSDTDVSQVNGAIGVRFSRQDTVNHGFATFNLDLLYESSLGDNAVQFDGQLGGSDLSIAAPSTNRSGFLIGAETGWALSDASSLGFRYEGRLGSSIQSHTGEIQFSLMF